MEACYNVLEREFVQSIGIEGSRIGFKSDMAVKVAKKHDMAIYDLSISHYGRTYAERRRAVELVVRAATTVSRSETRGGAVTSREVAAGDRCARWAGSGLRRVA